MGLFKEMFTNTQGLSDIVTQPTNILNKVFRCKQTFYRVGPGRHF